MSSKLKYDEKYSIITYILFFFTFAFAGWCFEVLLHLARYGVFVNKGALLGPWLPIYGYGGILILILLKKFRDKPVLVIILSMIISGIIEYATSWYLEYFHNMTWWDYKDFYFNINGRICLEVLLVFGACGFLITYFIAPKLNQIYSNINPKIKLIICIVLLVLFGIDKINSYFHINTGNGITEVVEKK